MEKLQKRFNERKIVPANIKKINWIILISLISYLCCSFCMGLIKAVFGEQFEWLQSVALSAVVGEIGMILPAVVYLCYKKVNWKEELRLHKIKISTILLLIIFAYTIMPLMNFLSMITMLFSKNIIANTLNQLTSNNSSFVAFIVIAVIPCMLEEFLYRGVVYGNYAKENKKFGIFLSGLLFGLVHMNINQFAYAFIMGVLFAMLIEATNSIVSSMIVHLVINGTSVILQYVGRNIDVSMSGADTVSFYTDEKMLLLAAATWGGIAIFTTVASVLVYYTIAKNEGCIENVKEIFMKRKKERLVSMPLIATIIICVVFMWQLSF